ncbi:hypothetical protein [Micromonospora sp. KC213]|uniref:hypothetical protein n=1 Tax=Micromonospora sp. KC213 TaxID=2530378 RepID=UPI00104B771B|nr:hypothetical protein [Micromonospora sp. KC213]TDC35722.1 hypothetical protein E1166_23285 [Micromonospora sp. KC213]
MRLFLVETVHPADYDNFEAAVVYARDAEDAIRVVRETVESEDRYKLPGAWWEIRDPLKATPVVRKRGPILGWGQAG